MGLGSTRPASTSHTFHRSNMWSATAVTCPPPPPPHRWPRVPTKPSMTSRRTSLKKESVLAKNISSQLISSSYWFDLASYALNSCIKWHQIKLHFIRLLHIPSHWIYLASINISLHIASITSHCIALHKTKCFHLHHIKFTSHQITLHYIA